MKARIDGPGVAIEFDCSVAVASRKDGIVEVVLAADAFNIGSFTVQLRESDLAKWGLEVRPAVMGFDTNG